jgi:hypothetical protein
VSIGAVQPVTGAALVAAGLLSVLVFPPIALARLRSLGAADVPAPEPEPVLHAMRPMGTQL